MNPEVDVRVILHDTMFWREIVLCCVHLPPFMTGEMSLKTLDNIVVYRYEMLNQRGENVFWVDSTNLVERRA